MIIEDVKMLEESGYDLTPFINILLTSLHDNIAVIPNVVTTIPVIKGS